MNPSKIAVAFADSLSRMRALTEEETDMLCAIIMPDKCRRRRWRPADDRDLQRMSRRGLRPAEIAEKTGRTEMAVRMRMHRTKVREMECG